MSESDTTNAPSMNDLIERCVQWHQRRFPDAQVEHVAMKLSEETGEVCRALNGHVGHTSATGDGDPIAETADVLICAFVLAGRFLRDDDLLAAITRKIETLENGNHPASLGVRDGG